jgi:hypothetical protein
MDRIIHWYHTTGFHYRKAIVTLGVVACLVGAGIVGYILLVPSKVEVRYGTVVRDPVDGHVWEDNTKTIRVDPDQTEKYNVKYVDKLSPEHAQQAAQEEARKAQEEAELAQLKGVEKMGIPLSSQQLINIRLMLENVDVSGVNVVEGIEMSNALSATKSKLVGYRNQIAGMSVSAEVAPLKDRALAVFDKYIQACDLYLLAMSEANQSYMYQANALVNEANEMIPHVK